MTADAIQANATNVANNLDQRFAAAETTTDATAEATAGSKRRIEMINEVTPAKEGPARKSPKKTAVEEMAIELKNKEESLQENASRLTRTKGQKMTKMNGFADFTVEIGKLMNGTSSNSLLDIAAEYKKRANEIQATNVDLGRLRNERNEAVFHLKQCAVGAAKEMKETAEAWSEVFNDYSKVQYIEERPTEVNEMPGALTDAVNAFADHLEKMKGDNGSIASLGGKMKTFAEVLEQPTPSPLQTIIKRIEALSAAQKTAGIICYILVGDDDEAQFGANDIRDKMELPLIPPSQLHKFAKQEAFRIILVFKHGDERVYVYHERRPGEGEHAELFLLSIDNQVILHESKYLWCTAVVGDYVTFGQQVHDSLGLPTGYMFEGIYAGEESQNAPAPEAPPGPGAGPVP